MNIDLLPFTAFALESCRSTEPVRGDLHTLTLQLALSSARSPHEPMSGRVTAKTAVACGTPLRASVLPADATALTITF